MKLFIKFAIGFSILMNVQPLAAGQVTHLANELGCIETVLSGRPMLAGISIGHLPSYAHIRQCSGQTKRITIRNGKLLSVPASKTDGSIVSSRHKKHSIPDGLIAFDPGDIRQSWLINPTRRYDHGILGDAVEAGGLTVKLATGHQLQFLLNKKSVFEDRMPRLVDLDNDGKKEIIVIQSSLAHGSAVAVYGVRGSKIVELASSRPIGRSHRWLNLVAAADFDGDGNTEIAWVETPHIGGTLKIARLLRSGKTYQLKTIGELYGFSNHQIGSRQMMMSVTFDWNGDGITDIILPDAERRSILVVTMIAGKLKVIDKIPITGEIASPLIAADLDDNGKGELLLVTKSGRLLSFSP